MPIVNTEDLPTTDTAIKTTSEKFIDDNLNGSNNADPPTATEVEENVNPVDAKKEEYKNVLKELADQSIKLKEEIATFFKNYIAPTDARENIEKCLREDRGSLFSDFRAAHETLSNPDLSDEEKVKAFIIAILNQKSLRKAMNLNSDQKNLDQTQEAGIQASVRYLTQMDMLHGRGEKFASNEHEKAFHKERSLFYKNVLSKINETERLIKTLKESYEDWKNNNETVPSPDSEMNKRDFLIENCSQYIMKLYRGENISEQEIERIKTRQISTSQKVLNKGQTVLSKLNEFTINLDIADNFHNVLVLKEALQKQLRSLLNEPSKDKKTLEDIATLSDLSEKLFLNEKSTAKKLELFIENPNKGLANEICSDMCKHMGISFTEKENNPTSILRLFISQLVQAFLDVKNFIISDKAYRSLKKPGQSLAKDINALAKSCHAEAQKEDQSNTHSVHQSITPPVC